MFSYNIKNIPKELINLILEYDGRIKYKNGYYVDIIPKNDLRYAMLHPIIIKKLEIIKDIQLFEDSGFYFEFDFDSIPYMGLCFDYNFTFTDKFEICYFDTRDGWIQIRTYI